jgi:hypothetical protein
MNEQDWQEAWVNARPLMQLNRDNSWMIQALRDELTELEEVIEGEDIHAIESEMADVIIFMLSLASNKGIDLMQATREKIASNFLRYPAVEFQEGDYQEQRQKCKAAWKNW